MAASFQIRKYQDDDAETVREIFTLGLSEHVPSLFMHLLKQPVTQMVLMCVFCTLMASSKSFLLPILAVTLLLAGIRQFVVHMANRYIETGLSGDLNDISEAYLKQKDSCFWVAESDSRVVGCVACLPAENAPGCLQMKRLSVRRSHRATGIAKALCRTVADFSSERGHAGVILCTSMVQTSAQKLYEHMGYERIREFAPPGFLFKVTNFVTFEYRLDLQRSGKKDN
ncbi:probable N-acetyltransferase CML1 [Brachionichthys hirsutus]|uniref:probable N-acetyltransferase CML1 n=1 Tax=Brachionichthys hirsutus TaxID=412623 RepID=UPI0036047359